MFKRKIEEDIIGKKYNKLTVKSVTYKQCKNRFNPYAMCECECGNTKEILAYSVVALRTGSCGCDKSGYRKITGANNKGFTGCGEIRGKFWSNLVRHAKERGIECNIALKEIWELFLKQDRMCALSGIPLTFGRVEYSEGTASLDRIDSKKGYKMGNVQWVHKDINWMKNRFTQEYFIDLCKKIAKFK